MHCYVYPMHILYALFYVKILCIVACIVHALKTVYYIVYASDTRFHEALVQKIDFRVRKIAKKKYTDAAVSEKYNIVKKLQKNKKNNYLKN